jgi:hypothetical protein
MSCCFLLFAVTAAGALEVQDVRWGFDGHVVPGRFNLVSVLVANSSDAPFDGNVDIYKTRGLADRVGAVYDSPCYLASGTARWLQFYVYIDNQNDSWRLAWSRSPNDTQDIDAPKWGPPAQVLISNPESVLSPASTFKQFPEELFPPTIAATSGLDSLLLDHAPRWETAQRQAFLDWLHAGGKVFLLQDADGRYPVFSDELSTLNVSGDRTHIGAGLVVRGTPTARDIRKQDLGGDDVPRRNFQEYNPNSPDQISDSFFTVLARLSQRHYDWGWIYLMAIAYVVLAGPGNLLAARKLPDYRLRIVLLLATVAGFAFLFNFAGRRGEGETSVVHTLSYARAIDSDTYDVMQWANVFATHGADYTITHSAPYNFYATGQDYEAVNGQIENGKNGQFMVDIPMFSRRAFMHEAEMKGSNISLNIVKWDGSPSINELLVTTSPEFSKQILDGWLVQGNQIYTMNNTKDGLEFQDSYGQSLETLMSAPSYDPFPGYYGSQQPVIDVDKEFRKLEKPLIAWSLGTEDYTNSTAFSSAGNEQAQLFLFARSPDSFSINGTGFGHEIGYVLYHFDLFKPGSTE